MRRLILDKSNRVSKGFKRITGYISVAANAGASVLAAIAVDPNTVNIVEGIIRASAGSQVAPAAIASAVAGTDVVTTSAAHGLTTGQPVIVSGITGLTGVVVTTVYFVNAVSATTLTLHDTAANAILGGANGRLDITADGTGTITGVPVQAVYFIRCAVRNRAGVTSLLGSVDILALEDVAAWAGTIVANNTNDTFDITGTPDASLATKFEWVLNITPAAAEVSAA